MPSLTTVGQNSRHGATYSYIIPKPKLSFEQLKQRIHRSVFISKHILYTSLFVTIITFLPMLISDFLTFHYFEFYFKWQLFWIKDIFYFVIGPFTISIFFVSDFMCYSYFKSQKQSIFKYMFIPRYLFPCFLCIAIHGTFVVLLLLDYHSNTPIVSNKMALKILCDVVYCEYFSVFWVYIELVTVAVLPMIYCLLVICYCLVMILFAKCKIEMNGEQSCHRRNNSAKHNYNYNYNYKRSTVELSDNLLNKKISSGVIANDTNMDYSYSYNYHTWMDVYVNWLYLLSYIALFWFLWMFVFFTYWLFIYVRNNIVLDHFEETYYAWLLFTIVAKFILKQIARFVDKQRIKFQFNNIINHNNNINGSNNFNFHSNSFHLRLKSSNIDISDNNNYNNSNHQINCKFECLFSMEWITEMIMSSMYWYFYRLLVIINFQRIPVTQVILLHTLHFITEFIQTSIRTSECYHSSTELLWNHWERYNHLCCGNVKRIRYYIKDNSNYNEWITRHCVDIIIRFNCSVASAIYWFFLLCSVGPDGYKQDPDDWVGTYYYAIIFVISTLGIEVLYFICAIMLQADNNPQCTIINAFHNVWNQHKKKLLVTFVCCWFLIIPD